MTTERDPRTRMVLDWLREDAHENAERVLLRALDEVDITPQRRSWRSMRRDFQMTRVAMAATTMAAALTVVIGSVVLSGLWTRGPAAQPSPSPSPSAASTLPEGSWWPQTSLAELRDAQARADAGDPAYTWQVDTTLVGDASPWDAEIIGRFARERLGWEAFAHLDGMAYVDSGSLYTELVLIRCDPGRRNPLYPNDPDVGGCAPTIDDHRFETVTFTIEQVEDRSPTGIWIVTSWAMLGPGGGQVAQATPASEAEATALLGSFLGARVKGAGAEAYLERPADGEETRTRFEGPAEWEAPLLYATTRGGAYVRSEVVPSSDVDWPEGTMHVVTRLFAGDGTVVEQRFAVGRREDGSLGLGYEAFSTTEDGREVPVPYRYLDGEVAFAAASPWSNQADALYLGNWQRGHRFWIGADPLPVAGGCAAGPAAADAASFARTVQGNPGLQATAPVRVRIGGFDALQLDVTASAGAQLCPQPYEGPLLMAEGTRPPWEVRDATRVRLYLLDLPSGSARLLVIAVAADGPDFDEVVAAATPVIESIQFHLP